MSEVSKLPSLLAGEKRHGRKLGSTSSWDDTTAMHTGSDVDIDLHLDLFDDVPWLHAGEDHASAPGIHCAALELNGSGFEVPGPHCLETLDTFEGDHGLRVSYGAGGLMDTGDAAAAGCTALPMAPPQQQQQPLCAGRSAFQPQALQELPFGSSFNAPFASLQVQAIPDSDLLLHKPAGATDLGFSTFLPLFSSHVHHEGADAPGIQSAGSVGTSDSAGTNLLASCFGTSSFPEPRLQGGGGQLFPQSPAGSDDRSAYAGGAFASAPMGLGVVPDVELLGVCNSGSQIPATLVGAQPHGLSCHLYLVEENGVLTLRTKSTAASSVPVPIPGPTAANALAASLTGPAGSAVAPPTPSQVLKRRGSRSTRPRQQGPRGKPRTGRNVEANNDSARHLDVVDEASSSTLKRKHAGADGEARAGAGAAKSPRPAGARAIAAAARTASSAITAADTDEDEDPDKKRKQHNPWGLEETEDLIEGVERCGCGRWADIKKLGYASIQRRSAVDLKDKWRNLVRVARQPNYGIKLGVADATAPEGEGAGGLRAKGDKRRDVPIHLLERVRAAMEANPRRPRSSQ